MKKKIAKTIFPEGYRVKYLKGKESARIFGERFGITGSNIANVIGGNQRLSIGIAILISKHYRVTLDWIYGISNEGGPGDFVAEPIQEIQEAPSTALMQMLLDEKDKTIQILKDSLDLNNDRVKLYQEMLEMYKPKL